MDTIQDQFSISKQPRSGCRWEKNEFAEIRSPRVKKTKSFFLLEVIASLFQSLQKELGIFGVFWLFLKASTVGYLFYSPKWHPEYFRYERENQEKYYKECYDHSKFFIIVLNVLARKHGEKEADRILADSIMPCTLAYMKQTYQPVENCTSIEPWWEQSVDYIGDMPENNQGLDGTVYIAEDRSELKWHTEKCAHAEVFWAYGLKRMVSCMCMGDHITFHTLFPGMIFKRTSCIGTGDSFCDHYARMKTSEDIGNQESQYGDCHHFEGGREYVRYWEEYAKGYFFGSKEKWQRFADNEIKKIEDAKASG